MDCYQIAHESRSSKIMRYNIALITFKPKVISKNTIKLNKRHSIFLKKIRHHCGYREAYLKFVSRLRLVFFHVKKNHIRGKDYVRSHTHCHVTSGRKVGFNTKLNLIEQYFSYLSISLKNTNIYFTELNKSSYPFRLN